MKVETLDGQTKERVTGGGFGRMGVFRVVWRSIAILILDVQPDSFGKQSVLQPIPAGTAMLVLQPACKTMGCMVSLR